jgi:hypothetical protein
MSKATDSADFWWTLSKMLIRVAVGSPLFHCLQDADKLLHFYPYIQSKFNYNCSTELREADKAPYTPGKI